MKCVMDVATQAMSLLKFTDGPNLASLHEPRSE